MIAQAFTEFIQHHSRTLKYQAIQRGEGLSEHELVEPPQGSTEDVFRRAGLPRFVLDLRDVTTDSAESGGRRVDRLCRREARAELNYGV